MFKLVYAMKSNPIFEPVLLRDITQISEAIHKMSEVKREFMLSDNDDKKSHMLRQVATRNM